jgi:tetratricopeptide (TPR) repeat protein
MSKMLLRGLVLAALAVSTLPAAYGQQAKPSGVSCPILQDQPSEADLALFQNSYPKAEELYKAALASNPHFGAATAGMIHAKLGEGDIADALAMAIKFAADNPQDALAQVVLGEVRFRRGEIIEAAQIYSKSLQMNPCLPEERLALARYHALRGNYLMARKYVDMAHSLAPNDPAITRRWTNEHRAVMSLAATKEDVEGQLQKSDLNTEIKFNLQNTLKAVEVPQKGNCQLVQPIASTKLKLIPLQMYPSDPPFGIGLDVYLNGKRRRLQVDTGASGLLLSRSSANAAGLTSELEIKESGIGDEGLRGAYVTHVDDIKIGDMEFKNCQVRVIEKKNVLDIGGLIGTDVFKNYLVTLDIPQRELRLSPLPSRPEEVASATTSLDPSADSDANTDAKTGERVVHDTYVAPEMKDWTRIYRWGHDLIVPTNIGKVPTKLFILDTGSALELISPDVAREVTHVYGDSDMRITGLSGEVNKVMEARNLTITFAHIQQKWQSISSIDTSNLSRGSGVEIGGFIGFPTLKELVLSIDYRDNLLKVVYDPKHGFHAF